jgi:hypothetical protein
MDYDLTSNTRLERLLHNLDSYYSYYLMFVIDS